MRHTMSRLLLLSVLTISISVHAVTLNAINQIVYIQPNTDIIINLYPSNPTSSSVNITTLPTSPIYTVSPNYITYGYTPASWSKITATSTYVNNATAGNTNTSIVYNCGFTCTRDRLTFTVLNTTTNLPGNTGVIDLILTDNVLSATQFNSDQQQFDMVVPSAATPIQSVGWSGTSIGTPTLLNHYIYNTAIPPAVNKQPGISQRWYFSSNGDTSEYTRNIVNAYYGQLAFNIGIFAGDFTTAANQRALPLDFVQLICATCVDPAYPYNSGITLSQRNVMFNGQTQTYTFALAENNGWLKDPQDTRVTSWPVTSQCEMLYVLSRLSELRIYGAYTYGYEVIAVDNIVTSVSTGVPAAAYLSNNTLCQLALS